MNDRPTVSRILFASCCVAFFWNTGCVHKIHVTPSPPLTSEKPIAESVQVLVPFLALEGADHMPGIGLLEWPAKDLQAAVIEYLQKRQTFAAVGQGPGSLTLTIKAWLTMRSRDSYIYRLRMESALGPTGKPALKSYLVEKEAVGSSVRWVTASDEAPIQQAVQDALDDLVQQIEADAPLYRQRSS